jgi:hypothetical protein
MSQPQYIYHLIDEGFANKHTVSKLINRQDKTALQRYLNECRKRRDNQLLIAEKQEAEQMQLEMCRRWVDEAIAQAGGDIKHAKSRIAELKQFCEDFGLVDAMRKAWIEKTKQS